MRLQRTGFPHSDIHGSQVIRHLPVAYRSLSRPSSASRAKASSIRPYLLSNSRDAINCISTTCFSYFLFNMSKNVSPDKSGECDEYRNWTDSSPDSSAGLLPWANSTICQQRTYTNFYFTKWRRTGSNRWPPECKSGALANWATPPGFLLIVVPGRVELPTSTLSV